MAARPGALLAVQRVQGNRYAQKVVRAARAPVALPVVQRAGFPPAAESSSSDLVNALQTAAASSTEPKVSRVPVFRTLAAAPYSARQDARVAICLETLFAAGSAERLAGDALQVYGPVEYWPQATRDALEKQDEVLLSLILGLVQEWKIDEHPKVTEDRQKANMERLMQGKELLPSPPPIKALFVPGRTAQVALVLGGVHGDEPSGVEVAEMLVEKLKGLKTPPLFTVVVVPRLFAANVEAGRRETPGAKDAPVNRNFPTVGTGTDTAAEKKPLLGDKGYPLDSKGRRIQPENLALLELIRKFKPVRIASVHAHPDVNSAGVFAEVHRTAPDASEADKKDAAEHSKKDRELALETAQKISNQFPKLNQGNKLGKPGETAEFPPGPSDKGVSFGEFMRAPVEENPYGEGKEDRPSITTFTVEVAGTERSGQSQPKPAADRADQLAAYADALLEVFLNKAP